MATTPSQVPVPSEKPQDLRFNAGKLDEFITSMGWTYTDRFGEKHYTIEGLRHYAEQVISTFGYVTMDSFEDGATLTLPNQVLRWKSNGEYYRWDGDFPKSIPAGSTPDISGGIGLGAWLSVGDATLRGNLLSEDETLGDALITVKQSFNGAIRRTQHDINAQFLSVEDAGAIGDGENNDTAAFILFESSIADRDIDLHGKTFVVDSIPAGNRYFNGDFQVGDTTYKASHMFIRDINGVLVAGISAGITFPEEYVMSANQFSYSNASVAFGNGALAKATKAAQCIAIGPDAMGNSVISYTNIALGEVALQNVQSTTDAYSSAEDSGTRNIAIGGNALQFLIDGRRNIGIGRNAATGMRKGSDTVALGSGALFGANVNGWFEYVECFLPNDNTDTNITAVGTNAGNVYAGITATLVGNSSGQNLKIGDANTFMGWGAGRDIEKPVGWNGFTRTDYGSGETVPYLKSANTITVTRAGHSCVVGGSVYIKWNDGPALPNHNHAWRQTVLGVTADTFTVACPYDADGSGSATLYWSLSLTAAAQSRHNTFLGHNAALNVTSAGFSIIIGSLAAQQATSTFLNSTVVGTQALQNVSQAASGVTALGYNALRNNIGAIANSTAVGYQAGLVMQDGSTPAVSVANSTMLGANTKVSGNNQVQIGDSATTTYVYGTVQNRSDERDKADIEDIDKDLAVQFVRGLSSKFYRWDMRDDYIETYEQQVGIDENAIPVFETRVRHLDKDGSKKRVRLHAGYLAQDIKALFDKLGIDFGLYQDHLVEGGCDVKTLGYDESIPMISAALSAAWDKLDEMAEKQASLESRVAALEDK